MRSSFAGKLAFMLLALGCTLDDFAEARRTHHNERRYRNRNRNNHLNAHSYASRSPHANRSSRANRNSHASRNSHTDNKTQSKGEATRPYYYASPIDTGFVDSDFFNLYNFSPIGYVEGGYNDPLANPAAKTNHYMTHVGDYDFSEPHPWYVDENVDEE